MIFLEPKNPLITTSTNCTFPIVIDVEVRHLTDVWNPGVKYRFLAGSWYGGVDADVAPACTGDLPGYVRQCAFLRVAIQAGEGPVVSAA
jgi:hypothetical protein